MRPDPETAEHYRAQFEQQTPSISVVLVELFRLVRQAAQAHDASCQGCGEMCEHLQHALSLIAATEAACFPADVLVKLQQRYGGDHDQG